MAEWGRMGMVPVIYNPKRYNFLTLTKAVPTRQDAISGTILKFLDFSVVSCW